MKETIKKILEYAANAPSGDNAQPWKFKVKGGRAYVLNQAESDPSLYNFKQRGSFFAHGALIENISITALHHGYLAKVELFPGNTEPDLVATIFFEKAAHIKDDSLYSCIPQRSTNRKPYRPEPLQAEFKDKLIATAGEIGYGEIRLVDKPEKIRTLAQAISLNERLILENRNIHDVLFSHITWSEEEARKKRTGLYVKTLELKPPEETAFRLFKNWRLLKLLNMAGVSKLLPVQSAKLYASSAAIGCVLIKRDSDEEYLLAGRLFQRMWLKATQMGLSLSPVTGVAYLGKRIADGGADRLHPLHVELIKEAYSRMTGAFELSDEVMAMVFRIGYGDKPTATSFKLPPNITFAD